MNTENTFYQNELYLNAATAAFIRDSISRRFQLHWHFAGKCEALLLEKNTGLTESCEKLTETSWKIDQHFSNNDWKHWNLAYGLFDGFAEAMGLAVLAISSNPHRDARLARLQREVETAGSDEVRREVLKRLCLMRDLLGAFPKTCPLHWYFVGKIRVLRHADKLKRSELCSGFEAARDAAQTHGLDWKTRHYKRGLAAGYAEGAALSKSESRSCRRARA